MPAGPGGATIPGVSTAAAEAPADVPRIVSFAELEAVDRVGQPV